MTRLLLALGAVGAAVFLWLNVRDLIGFFRRGSSAAPSGVFARPDQPDEVQPPDPADDVQPADPVTVALREPGTRQALDEGLADLAAGRMRTYIVGEEGPDTLEPLTPSDRDWLDQTVRSSLHPST